MATLTDIRVAMVSFVDKSAVRDPTDPTKPRRALLWKQEGYVGKAELEIRGRLWKAEKEGKFYGVVLEPNLEDSQGDIVSPEEIESAAHRYMVTSRRADVQHSEIAADARLIENMIAPQDTKLAGEHVTKGSWVQGWQINDPVLKQEIDEGKLTGLSIGGSAVRVAKADTHNIHTQKEKTNMSSTVTEPDLSFADQQAIARALSLLETVEGHPTVDDAVAELKGTTEDDDAGSQSLQKVERALTDMSTLEVELRKSDSPNPVKLERVATAKRDLELTYLRQVSGAFSGVHGEALRERL